MMVTSFNAFWNLQSSFDLEVGERRLGFEDRLVILVRGTAANLSGSLDVLNDLAEVRKAKESSAFFADASSGDQAQWLDDLKGRTNPPGVGAPAVCILDTGVTRAHPLLEDLIVAADAMSVDAGWGGHDDGGGPGNMGHGTEMAGLAGYGDLVPVLVSGAPVNMRHRLESVKILPPTGASRGRRAQRRRRLRAWLRSSGRIIQNSGRRPFGH
jgi:Subtilase family